jgi:TetR/AcrR family transcriptional repressor of mexJK operon
MDGERRRRPGRPAGLQGADLLDVARTVFLEHGFAATTMHEIAARAGISKASLYRDHPSKDALFAAVVTDWAARGRGAMRPLVEQLLDAEDLHAALVDLAATLQAAVLDADVIGIRRLVTAESDRFPDVAAAYLADSWDSNIAALATTLSDLDERGRLSIDDPQSAAHQFTWTAIGASLNAHTIAGNTAATSPDQQQRFAALAATALTGPRRRRAKADQRRHR